MLFISFVLIEKILILSSFILPSAPLNLKGIPYPWYSKLVGYIIILSPLTLIPGCAYYQCKKHDWDWKILLNPHESYYDNYRKFMRSQDAEKAISFDNQGFFNSQIYLERKNSHGSVVTAFWRNSCKKHSTWCYEIIMNVLL